MFKDKKQKKNMFFVFLSKKNFFQKIVMFGIEIYHFLRRFQISNFQVNPDSLDLPKPLSEYGKLAHRHLALEIAHTYLTYRNLIRNYQQFMFFAVQDLELFDKRGADKVIRKKHFFLIEKKNFFSRCLQFSGLTLMQIITIFMNFLWNLR